MEILFLGTSGSGVNMDRNLPSLIIDRKIVIDCGEGFLKTLYENQIDPNAIRAIFITHLHADHVLGLVSYLWREAFYQYDPAVDEDRVSVPIYLPAGMKSNVEHILGETYSTFTKVNYRVNFIELPEICDEPLKINVDNGESKEYSIEWHKTVHSPICYAYKFNNQVVFSGDTSPFPKFRDFVKNCELLIHEATFFDEKRGLAHSLKHSTPLDAAELAFQAKVNQLVLIHVPNIPKNQEKMFLQKASKRFPEISIASDNQILRLE